MNRLFLFLFCACIILSTTTGCKFTPEPVQFRAASYNVSMFRDSLGALAKIIAGGLDTQIQHVAAVIQTVRPDVLVLMEFDYDSSGFALDLFRQNYLEVPQFDLKPIEYPYGYQVPSNTGVDSHTDLNSDGKIQLPDDAFGFGRFEGQYASAILSKYPLDTANARSFRKFLWKDMPGAMQPRMENGENYYPTETWEKLRLSSKNHLDIPVILPNNEILHVLISHPTPPVFDGVEDRNGMRNHDEVRFWTKYISNASFMIDDYSTSGGLESGNHFIIAGDLNTDPFDGDSRKEAINDLLDHPLVNYSAARGENVPSSPGGGENGRSSQHRGDPSHDTSFYGLRIDYLIPSETMEVLESGVFWPSSVDRGFHLVENRIASDHLLVWMDILIK